MSRYADRLTRGPVRAGFPQRSPLSRKPLGAVCRISALALLVTCVTRGLSAQNLLKNASFDEDLTSWQVLEAPDGAPGAMFRSTADASGSRSSGSLELSTSATFGHETFSVGQCVVVMQPSEYAVFGGKILSPSGQPVVGLANLHLEYFRSASCSGRGLTQTGLGGIANADFWSKRADFASIRGAAAVRLIASVYKKYEFQEGDQTGQVDDHVPFHAFFDDLFLQLMPESELGKFFRGYAPTVPEGVSDVATTAVWGKKTVQGPTLLLTAFGRDGRELDSHHVEFSSLEQIGVSVRLKTPYTFDDPEWYPLQDFSVVSRLDSQNLNRPPTLEFFLSRAGDPDKRPIPIAVDSAGGGVVDGHPDTSAHISLEGKSEFRMTALRTTWGCNMALLPDDKRKAMPALSDEQLLANPFLAYLVANPPGEYELVARYRALEAGFWHLPVYSAPLRIRIVRRDVDCTKPQPSGK